jgi:hypothetical protein
MAGGFLSGLGKMLDVGAAYMQHVAFAQRALQAAPQERGALLVQYTRPLSDASFAGFKVSLAMLAGNEQDAARRAALQQLIDNADVARRGQVVAPAAAPGARLAGGTPLNDFDADLKLFAHWYDDLDETQRRSALIDHVFALSAPAYRQFRIHIAQMVANCDDAIRRHEASENQAWGGFAEDRIAYQMARLRTGQRDPGFLRELQGLQNVKAFAEWVHVASEQVWHERAKREAAAEAPPAAAALASAASRPDIAAIKQAVLEFTRSGQYPGGIDKLKADVTALTLSGEGEEVMAILEAAGGKEGGDEVLNIQEHYRPGDGRLFQLRWPIEFPLPLPFEELDRPTQFSVLWGEYSRRMLEGSHAVLEGDAGQARAIYAECLERAQQLDVPELIARSHEGMARAAAKGNQRSEERKHLKLAVAARQRT